jgi:hypothetical protein
MGFDPFGCVMDLLALLDLPALMALMDSARGRAADQAARPTA